MNWGHSSTQDDLQGQRGNVNPLPQEEMLSFSPGPAGGGGRELVGCRLTIYINLSLPGHTTVGLGTLRGGDGEQRLWKGERWQLRPGRQAGARLLRGL